MLPRLSDRAADVLDRIACALWSVAHRLRPITPPGPLCPDCRVGPALPEGVECPTCRESWERQRMFAEAYEQGRADVFDDLRDCG